MRLPGRSRSARAVPEFLQFFADAVRMALCPHVVEHLGQLPFGVDDEGGTDQAGDGCPERRFFSPRSVRFGGAVVLVAEQGEGEAMVIPELLMRAERVGGNSEHPRVQAAEVVTQVAR